MSFLRTGRIELVAQLSVLLVMRQLLLYFFIAHSVDSVITEHVRLGNQTVVTYHRYATAHGARQE